MNDYNVTAIMRKYKRCVCAVGIPLLVFAIILFFATNSRLLYAIALFAALWISKIAGAICYLKFYSSVLTVELNLPKYIDLIKASEVVTNSLIEHLDIAYFSGDYNQAINICNLKLQDPKLKNRKWRYLLILARCYSEMGDLENLNKVNEMFKDFVAKNKHGKKIKERLIYFKFVDLSLAGDFSSAKELYQELYLKQKEKQKEADINDLSTGFTFAVCCYQCGDFAKATELFNEVIAIAPSFHYAKIAKRYLAAMENQTEYKAEPITLDANTANIPIPKSRKRRKIFNRCVEWLLLMNIIFSVIALVLGAN